ncbi:PREDICTED: zinc finger protein 629 [Rhagoletis zephyria]|uniref:zinc finger protein 629 n=1 Tax=Rhagoletis zephyria TaxID=28612 RepID=UPI00081154FE|nr:PREDICTED: zinc finger protein 629 [Rhagoletis zephyria]XP_017484058.1 PREDICTED: zinc finger protein 629 [Rhagoletis zephyria]XP_017484059.1 PREDICTED: zinc finger protein 629 [Rhagoletis zephyria]
MEILMKLKCSPSGSTHGNSNSTLSTLKVVDHHHQLTQQHAALPVPPQTASPSLVRLPSQTNVNYNSTSVPISLHTVPRMPATRPCMNYSKPLECCNVASTQQEIELFDVQWDQQGRRGITYEVAMQRPQSCCTNIARSNLFESNACCSGPCTLSAYGTSPALSHPTATATLSQPPPLQQAPSVHPPPLAYPIISEFEIIPAADINTHYEYQEPEENFISIEDSKIKGLLLKIGRESALEKKRSNTCKNKSVGNAKEEEVFFEIIDLDDEDDREELRQIRDKVENAAIKRDAQKAKVDSAVPGKEAGKHRINSPSISLIPKSPPANQKAEVVLQQKKKESSKERIIAHIELSDSSDSEADHCGKSPGNIATTDNKVDADAFESDTEDDELPFAAAAVSCELKCDDDDNYVTNSNEVFSAEADISSGDVVVIHSDDENAEFIDQHEKGVERHWDDLDRREKCRQFFECYLCGKKVQSSYNLRRHMMIHTGERPFGCDMCDRRFREYSDLKKHRRRHANEPNFVCMVCRVKPPTMQDPTRCNDCDSKTSAITAAMRPQLSASPSASPDKLQTSPLSTSPPLPLPQLTAKPLVSSGRVWDVPATSAVSIVSSTATNSNSNIKGSSKSVQEPTTNSSSPKRPSSTTLLNSEMPSLVPINAPITVQKTVTTSTQLLLDNIPVVHRHNYNEQGIVTRKEFSCPLCQRPFGTRHNLKRHFMIHTGEKPFSCNKCRKPFREYSTLKKHMVTHQRDRYYKCLHCPRKYRDYLEYSEHKTAHANENDDDEDDDDANFDQQQLSSSSSTSSPQKRAKTRYDSSYDSNEEDSSTEDWLECCECKQRFTEIESYTKHLKEHDPSVYLYECYICKKTFELRDELVEHVSACKEELRETALQRATCFN